MANSHHVNLEQKSMSAKPKIGGDYCRIFSEIQERASHPYCSQSARVPAGPMEEAIFLSKLNSKSGKCIRSAKNAAIRRGTAMPDSLAAANKRVIEYRSASVSVSEYGRDAT